MADIAPITLKDLTEAKVSGDGVFDTLMRGMVGHLELEFNKNRLRGADYAQVYLSSLTPVLQNAVVFLLQKDEAANKANLVQAQIDLTKLQGELIQLEIAREELTRGLIEAQIRRIDREIQTMDLTDQMITAQTLQQKAETLNTSQQLLNLKSQDLLTNAQVEQQKAETLNTSQQLLNLKSQDQMINAQVEQQKATTINTAQELLNLKAQECLLKAQYDLAMLTKLQTTAQTSLIQQKMATEKAQTVETGVDDNSVIGRQKILYKAQSDGFQRDAEQKAAKLLTDTWNVRRTTDEGTVVDTVNMLNDATIGRAITKMLSGVNA